MSTLYIREYNELARDLPGAKMPVGKEPALASQTVSFTTSSVQSTAFQSDGTVSAPGSTFLVRVISDADALLEFGANPTAVATSILVKAGVAEYFGVVPGHKVAVKQV